MSAHTHAAGPGASDVVFVSCVRHSFDDGTEVHLCGLDFIAKRGQRVALLGPNGSGKTTMIYHILGLLKSEEGVVRVFDANPAQEWPSIRRRVGIVLQNVDEQILSPTVADDVAFSPRQYGLPDDEVERRVSDLLKLLGIEELRHRVPHNLSGGEKRKVALAGALVMDPDLLVLDEPFEGLDPASREMLTELTGSLAEAGTTVVISTHDIDAVPELADYAYLLAPGGEIVVSGTPEELFAQADLIASGNVRPPILAELFAAIRERDASGPAPALSIDAAAEALLAWKRPAGCGSDEGHTER